MRAAPAGFAGVSGLVWLVLLGTQALAPWSGGGWQGAELFAPSSAQMGAAPPRWLLDLAPAAQYWVVPDPSGDSFLVASWVAEGSGESARLYGVLFDAAGNPLSDPSFLDRTAHWVALDDRDFAVLSSEWLLHAWTGARPDGAGEVARARFVSAGGAGAALVLSESDLGSRSELRLAPCADGRFAAVWQERQVGLSTRHRVVARAFADDGAPLGPEVVVSEKADMPVVACGPGGRWVVAWRSATSSVSSEARWRLLGRSGETEGPIRTAERPHRTIDGRELLESVGRPVLAADRSGWVLGFGRRLVGRAPLEGWQTVAEEVRAVRLDPRGGALGGPFRLDTEQATDAGPERLSLALAKASGGRSALFATWECRPPVAPAQTPRLCGRAFVERPTPDGGVRFLPVEEPVPLTPGDPSSWHGVIATGAGFLVTWTGSPRSPLGGGGGERAVWARLLPFPRGGSHPWSAEEVDCAARSRCRPAEPTERDELLVRWLGEILEPVAPEIVVEASGERRSREGESAPRLLIHRADGIDSFRVTTTTPEARFAARARLLYRDDGSFAGLRLDALERCPPPEPAPEPIPGADGAGSASKLFGCTRGERLPSLALRRLDGRAPQRLDADDRRALFVEAGELPSPEPPSTSQP